MKKTIFLTLILTLLLAACGNSTESTTTADSAAQFDPASQELGLSTQLALGTLKLEGTDQAIAPDQAAELLPLWQVLNSLSGSESASQAEIEALIQQIQDTMPPEQMAAIENMNLTRADIFATMQDLGLMETQVNAEGTPQAGGFSGGRPEGEIPGSGGGPGMGQGGGPGSGMGGAEISPEQMATAQARRAENGGGMNTRLLTPLIQAVIDLLESKVQ